MIFNGIEKSYVSVIRGRVRPFFAPLARDKKFDNNLVKTERGHRIIEVPIFIEYDNLEHFRALTEDIAGWLVHNEPKELTFNDEPDRIYYAIVDDTVNEDILYDFGTHSVIRFICGYKYSKERNVTAPGTHNIKGHKSTPWISRTEFTSNTNQYILQFNAPGKTTLREVNKIVINFNFIPGDILKVNFRKRSITVNDVDMSHILSIVNSNYTELPTGEDIQFEASEPTEIFYHECYY